MPDAITVLREDHRRVEKLFKEYEKLHKKGDGDTKRKRELVGEVIAELSKHAVIEEQVFYPAVREKVEDAEDVVLEGLEEHHIVKWTLSELDGMSGDEERFDAKVMVLMESVRHHVEEEEGEMFPKVRDAIPRKELAELMERMEAARAQAPGKPQPKAPDEPPANLPPAGSAPSTAPAAATGEEPKGAPLGGLLSRRRAKSGTKR